MPSAKIARYTSKELAGMRRKGTDRTDWPRVRTTKDKDIVIDGDAPEITEEFLRNAVITVKRPKQNLTLRVDPDVLEWFRAKGKGYQTRINAILRAYMQSQRKAS